MTTSFGALSHEPFLLVITHLCVDARFNDSNTLADRSRAVRQPLLARCDNTILTHPFAGRAAQIHCRWRRYTRDREARRRDFESGGAEVARARLAGALIRDDLEVDLLTFVQIVHPRALDGANVDEYVLAAVVRLNEAKTLLGIEPLNGSDLHSL